MPKKFNLDTIKGMTPNAQVQMAMWLIGAVVILVMGGFAVSQGSTVGIGIGLILMGVSGFFAYNFYATVINTKNQKSANLAWFSYTENVINPAGSDADTDEDITRDQALIKAQYDGYVGVWVRNTKTIPPSAPNNVDAFYISGDDTTTITLVKAVSVPSGTGSPSSSVISQGGTAYIKKGSKGDKGPKVQGP